MNTDRSTRDRFLKTEALMIDLQYFIKANPNHKPAKDRLRNLEKAYSNLHKKWFGY